MVRMKSKLAFWAVAGGIGVDVIIVIDGRVCLGSYRGLHMMQLPVGLVCRSEGVESSLFVALEAAE